MCKLFWVTAPPAGCALEDGDDFVLRHLQECVDSHPDDPSVHFNLGVFFWERVGKVKESNEKAAEHFLISAKLNPHNGPAFRFLGHYYSRVSVDSQRALKCYQRALTLSPDDSDAGESICDLLDKEGKETLEVAVCREASQKSPRAFWAFRRLGYLQVHQKKWSEAVHSLQHAIRGYPTSADLWEALGLAYQRLGMFTAAIKAYGRAVELEGSRVFALVESGNIFLMLGSFRKAIEQFREALLLSPQNVAAHYGLASGLLCLSKECMDLGAFRWGASTLEEASKVAKACTCLTGNNSCIWKLHGDIQLTYAKCFPWMEEDMGSETDEKAFNTSILSWKRTCSLAAVCASRSYQRALHLAPWQANIYTDVAMTLDVICSLKETQKKGMSARRLPEKMSMGGLLLEGCNNEFWVALGCLSIDTSLKQHAFIRSLQLDVSLAVAWAFLGKLFREVGEKQLAQQAFDRARSIDPSLALPWAGMSADMYTRKLTPDEAYECCLRAVQILPLAEFQIGLAKLALLSGHLSSSEVFGAIQQALQHAPHYPESHNLKGLVFEARHDYLSAAAFYRRACYAMSTSGNVQQSCVREIKINLARSLCRAGNAVDAVQECEDLKKEGLLDCEGLQIYALSLWQLGKNDLALSVARILAASILSMDRTSASASISFICRLLYYISGCESVIKSILKMPKELFHSTTVSVVVSSIHALSLNNELESIVSSSCSSLASHEEITGMNFLIALGKLVKHGEKGCIGIQNGVNHLRKTLHMYPNSALIRNLLSYLLLSSKEWEDTHLATRCIVVTPSGFPTEGGLKSACEILGAGAVACCTTGHSNEILSVPSCRFQCSSGSEAIRQLQKWLHLEPWNQNARYLLILNCLQKAREERYPQHLCILLERLISVALSDHLYSNKDKSYQYQKFQLLLCASEICFQCGDHVGCISHVNNASGLLLPDCYLFFAHLLLCRIFASEENLISLREEYMRCMELKTDYPIGWIYLKYMESRYKLQTGAVRLDLSFEECSKEIKHSWNMWMAVFNLVQGLVAIWTQDFLWAEKFFSEACSLATAQCCLFLCHGATCMELARQQCEPQFLSLAVRSLKKAKETSLTPMPIVSILLAQAEASFGSKAKWENNLRLEWFSWPPGMRPAELFLQMHLVSRQSSDSSSSVEPYQSPLKWILRAIHLNPSCLRYWKVLHKFMG
ncbi:hypothetical protein LguiB_020320 [Lonicera macranthoides]